MIGLRKFLTALPFLLIFAVIAVSILRFEQRISDEDSIETSEVRESVETKRTESLSDSLSPKVQQLIYELRSAVLPGPSVDAILDLGRDAVPDLIVALSEEEDELFKIYFLSMLREIGDENAIELLLDLLSDKSASVRSKSITALEAIFSRTEIDAWKGSKERLLIYANRDDEKAHLAISLLGKSGQGDALEDVRNFLGGALADSEGRRFGWLVQDRKRKAALRELARLGDDDVSQLVSEFSRSEDIEDRILAIETIEYSGKKNAPLLIAMLNDHRVAKNIGPSHGEYNITVSDLAAKALSNIYSIRIDVEEFERFSASEIDLLLSQLP